MQVSEILPSRLSTIDSQREKKLKQSTVDYLVSKLRIQLNDPALGARFVRFATEKLGEGEVINIAEWASRKAEHPGKVFVSICNRIMKSTIK